MVIGTDVMKNNRDSRPARHSVRRPYLYLGTVAMPDLAEFLQGFNFGETNVCPTFTLLLSFIGCGDAICCWPLDLSESSKQGGPGRAVGRNCFVVPCSCASMCRCTQSANQCPRARGRVRLARNIFWTD